LEVQKPDYRRIKPATIFRFPALWLPFFKIMSLCA
jgi:hypothetical protein